MMEPTADCPHADHVLEPIAIVGMACRLPGTITSPAGLWDIMVNKRSVQTPSVPKSRFNIDAFYHDNLNRPGSFDGRGGYFLDGSPHDFDPSFFGMSPIEAMWLDPQQRRILEVAYECLENAGLTLEDVAGKNIGVFVGCFTSDYQQMLHREPDFRHEYSATGSDPGLVSARVCNVFDLHGPSAVINTACSSSITAIHHACQSLQDGECDGAIAAGVNLILSVDQHLNTAKLGVLSPTSTCHTFDAAADGYGRGEGAGAIYLRRLSDAVRDGDAIRAIIRGSAVNTNGKVKDQGITHPSLEGQERVLRTAYKRAGLDPTDTLYVECHGTGTPVGDPIEVHAIARGMNDRRSCEQPLRLGAVKANIGHSEAASGIFAVIKAAMIVESAVIPGVAGFNILNPAIKEAEWNVKINVDTMPWPESPQTLTRRVGVSSFGYAGTNGHLILDAVQSDHRQEKLKAEHRSSCNNEVLVCFTAHDRATLERNIRAHARIAESYYLADLAYTLNCRRTHFSHRAFTIAHDNSQSRDLNMPAFEFGLVEAPAQIAFVFTGQGAQWLGMGRDAMCTLPTFSATIRSLDKLLQTLQSSVAWSLEESLLGSIGPDRITEPDVAQPLCTAIQIAIVDQLGKWGIVPSAVAGHSSGEIAAAYAAGLLSASEAFTIAFYRGLAVAQESPQGSMLAVGLGVEAMEPYVRDTDIVIACDNSAESVTLSGPTSGIQQMQTKLATAGVFVRELKTNRPYHSPAMNVAGLFYEQLLTEGSPEIDSSATPLLLSKVPMISSVTGLQVHEADINSRYWIENLTSRVCFHAAISKLCILGDRKELTHLVEIGPHSTLAGPLKQTVAGNKLTSHINYIPSFVRGSNSCSDLLRTAGRLFLAGYGVSLEDISKCLSNEQRPQLLVDLPPYQWNYTKKYWREPRVSQEQREESAPRHDLLGRRVAGLSNEICVWKNILRVRDVPWLRDHRVGSELLLPGAAYIALAIEALWQISDTQFDRTGVFLKDIAFQQGLVIPESDGGIELVTRLLPQRQSEPGWYSFTVESHLDNHWTTHCSGHISSNKRPPQGDAQRNSHNVETLHNRTQPNRWYRTFGRVGVDYGRSFQCLGEVRSNGRDFAAASRIELKTESGTMNGESRYILHPGAIDTCFQLAIISFEKGRYNVMPLSTIPLRVEQMTIAFPGKEEEGDAFAWTDECQTPFFRSHVQLFTARGLPILECKAVRFKEQELHLGNQLTVAIPDQQYMQNEWKPDIDHAAETVKYTPHESLQEALVALVRLIDHKRPVQRVLLFVEDDYNLVEAMASQFPAGCLTIMETLAGKVEAASTAIRNNNILVVHVSPAISQWPSSVPTSQDLIIVKDRRCSEMIQTLQTILKPGGRLLILRNVNAPDKDRCLECYCAFFKPVLQLSISGFNLLLSPELNNGESRQLKEKKFTFVVKENKDQLLLRELVEELDDRIETANSKELCDLGRVPHGRLVILDVDGSVLSGPTEAQFDMIKRFALAEGGALVWVTFGVNQGRTVEGGLSLGFLRGVRSEHPEAQIISLDIDWEETAHNIGRAITAALEIAAPRFSGHETEFWLHNGVLHISRIRPWACPGTSQDQQPVNLLLNTPLTSEYIDGELIFKANQEVERDLEADEICVQVEMTEFQATQERTKQPVIVVGHTLDNDNESALPRVVTFATQNGYSTIVRAKRDACLACEDLDPALLCATLPSLCKVLISMDWLGRAQKNDHIVLLHMPLPFVQLAALFCQKIDGRLSVVVEAPEERARFHRDPLLGSVSIIMAQDPSVYCTTALAKGTGKPSLVLSYSLSALAREAWKYVSTAGRFVLCDGEVGGTLDPTPFTRGASFLTMGYNPLALRPGGAAEVLQEGLTFLRQNKDIWPSGSQVYSVDQLSSLNSGEQFVRSDNGEGRAVQFRYGESTIKIQASAPQVHLSSEAVYLLVGGLGGIGNSLARWMVERGCRHFVFVSRSGMTQSKAAETVKWIERTGALVQVFQADAGNEVDMRAIVARVAKQHQIRGVVHAAMVLQDGMLHGMTAAQYSAAVTAKLKIAHVLHAVLSSAPLDFFIMTSSISATLGTPGQTNYSAGNSFLDGFARYRRSLGLPACSVALPMILDVGVVADNDTIENSLLQMGFYGIDEIEMLEGLEIAMCPNSPSHLMLGLDPCRMRRSAIRMFWHGDARLRGVQRDLDLLQASSPSAKGHMAGPLVDGEWQDYETWVTSVGNTIVQKCADVLGRDVAEIEFERGSIASHGLDSVISVELQQWLFAEFGLEMSFHAFTVPDLTVKALTERAIRHLGET